MTSLSQITGLMPRQAISFENPVKVRVPEFLLMIHEVVKTNEGDVYLRLSDGKFYELDEKDKEFENVTNQIVQRLKML